MTNTKSSTMMNLSRRRRNGVRILSLLCVFPFFILAQHGKLEIMNCISGPISVFSVYLTCDSAGSYYYGSSSYRNSSTCKYGDTAYIRTYLEVTKDFENDGVMVSVDAGVYSVLSSAIDPTDFCQVSELSTMDDDVDNADVCGLAGFYQLKTYFTLTAFKDDTHFHYTPDLRLRFYNATSMAVIGCAMTGTIAEKYKDTRHAEIGLMALGVSLLVLGTCFGLMIYLTYRRKKRMEQEQRNRRLEEYSYTRTTPNGRVLPFDGDCRGSVVSHGGSSGADSKSPESSQLSSDI